MAAHAAIAWSDLGEVIVVSLLAGTGVTAVFSLVILGGARAAEARRAGNGGAAALYGGLAVLSFAVFMVGLATGVTIMLSK